MSKQKTLAHPVSMSGVGLHTGRQVNMIFQPAAAGQGITFKRTDLDDQPAIAALATNVSQTARGTTIGTGENVIHTVEHVLAGLAGLEIDNCLIELDAPEPPIADGSAMPFIEKLEEVGTVDQDVEKNYYTITQPLVYRDEKEDIEIIALPAENYQVTVMVDYQTDVLGTQNAHMNDISEFKENFASSRTFSFLHELEFLLEQGLIKGGDLNNAIVYVDKEISSESMVRLSKAFNKEKVAVRANGILDNLELHFPNEAARHKLLDVVGDLTLVGRPIKGRIIATKPGHTANTNFAKMLIKQIKHEESKPKAPAYDPNVEPVLDVNQIQKLLPHRPPFLLVDKVLELGDDYVVGLKNVTMNESFFVGHFPGAPVMPGVLQIEAMAQVGGILALSTVPDPENYLTYFLKMDEVKFKNKVVPGDTLVFALQLLAPIRRGIVQMKGTAYVGNKIVSEAVLMAQITKNK